MYICMSMGEHAKANMLHDTYQIHIYIYIVCHDQVV